MYQKKVLFPYIIQQRISWNLFPLAPLMGWFRVACRWSSHVTRDVIGVVSLSTLARLSVKDRPAPGALARWWASVKVVADVGHARHGISIICRQTPRLVIDQDKLASGRELTWETALHKRGGNREEQCVTSRYSWWMAPAGCPWLMAQQSPAGSWRPRAGASCRPDYCADTHRRKV